MAPEWMMDASRCGGGNRTPNKITPRTCLGPEHEELRRTLRQDMRDALSQFAKAELHTLRQEARELLSQKRSNGVGSDYGPTARKQEEPVKAAPSGGADRTADVVAEGSGGSRGARMALFSDDAEIAFARAMAAHREEVFNLHLTVGELVALLQRASRGAPPDAALQRDIQAALRAVREKAMDDTSGARARRDAISALTKTGDPVPTGRSRDGFEGHAAPNADEALFEKEVDELDLNCQRGVRSDSLRESEGDEAEGRFSVTSTENTGAMSEAVSAVSGAMVTDDEGPYRWEWERSNGKGWAPYTRSRSKRIEQAWRKGSSRVRLRSGQEGKTPMEIFLVDMIQLDPVSMNQRRVRRIGRVPWWMTVRRHFMALRREIQTGERRWESFEQYKMRQELVTGPDIKILKARMIREQTLELDLRKSQKHDNLLRRRCSSIANSESFYVVSILVTVLQAIWIGVDVDKNFGLTLYQKPPFDQILDHFFCVFFCVDLLMRLTTSSSYRACWASPWFRFDAFLVMASVLEVFVFPPLQALSANSDLDWAGFGVFRVVRLAKIIRIFRVFGASSDAIPFFKGLLSGMRSAAFIWGLLLALLFMFGVLLRLNAHDDLVESHFSTVGTAMLTLMTSGVMLDEVAPVVERMLVNEDALTFVFFVTFVFLAHFNLLNMLIGAFCSVAGEVSASEKEAAQIAYLRDNLACIVDCYIHDEGHIGKKEFELIMKNADVHRTLADCGTDMDGLSALETLLFSKKNDIDFESLFKAIVHLRKGTTATVKDIMHVQSVLGRQLDAVRKRLEMDNLSPRVGPEEAPDDSHRSSDPQT